MNSVPQKRCCRCKNAFPATSEFFNRNRSTKDGLHPECRACRKSQRPNKKRRLTIPVLYDGDLKRCTACQEWLPATLGHFDLRKASNDGLHPRCKLCRKVEKQLERINHPEHIRERRRPYLSRPDVKRRAVKRTRQWIAHNPDRARRSRHSQLLRYRANKYNQPSDFNKRDWAYCLEWWHGCCAYCGKQRDFWHVLEADHFRSLSGGAMWGTVPSNIVPACRYCNASKGNKDPIEWLTETFGKHKGQQKLAKIQEFFQTVRQHDQTNE